MRVPAVLMILMALAACATRTQPEPPPPQTPLGRAAAFLWKQQADDGGWHSHTYGLLRSGQSLTPFVLDGLLRVPAADYPASPLMIDKAIAFIKSQTSQDGSL